MPLPGRPKKVCFIPWNYCGFIVITGRNLPQWCAIRGKHLTSLLLNTSLGGKQKPWIVEEYADSDLCSVPPGDIVKAVENTGIARLILLSPAIWSKGSRPGCWDPKRIS